MFPEGFTKDVNGSVCEAKLEIILNKWNKIIKTHAIQAWNATKIWKVLTIGKKKLLFPFHSFSIYTLSVTGIQTPF